MYFPAISVVVPVRNEANSLDRCLRSLLKCAYPHTRLQFLVIDGRSTDRTREVVRHFQSKDHRVVLVDNPSQTVPQGLNEAIALSTGEIIVRVDAHAAVATDFLTEIVRTLKSHPEAWCVGGPIETIGHGYVGRSIAAAMSSLVGAGNARFRLGDFDGYVDTIAFGAYRRWVFDKVGAFDPELVRNQDDEFNLRIIRGGGRIYMCRRIRSKYFPRHSMSKLWKQYYEYGFWRIRTLQKHRRPAAVRQLAPVLFVSVLALLLALSFLKSSLWWLPAVYLLGYFGVVAVGSLFTASRTSWSFLPILPVVYGVLHFSYGIGSVVGIYTFFLARAHGRTTLTNVPVDR